MMLAATENEIILTMDDNVKHKLKQEEETTTL